MAFIEFRDVSKIYKTGDVEIRAVDGVSFEIEQGEFCVIVGPSGAGKTTVLNMLGGMDTVSGGDILVDGTNISRYGRRELTSYRRYDREVSTYIVRENIVLMLFGIAFGLLLGHLLHAWLVLSVEIDLMMFGRDTTASSYVYAGILTAVFSVVVNLMAHYKMKKIDMVSSLKSPE